MSESQSHRRAKNKAAGKSGQTEVPIEGNRRLDAATARRATEVQRGSSAAELAKAALRLKDSGRAQKVLVVPQPSMNAAAKAMRRAGVPGTVKNMGGTKRRNVR